MRAIRPQTNSLRLRISASFRTLVRLWGEAHERRAIEPVTEGKEYEWRIEPRVATKRQQPELQLHVLLRMLLLQLAVMRLRLQSGARSNRQVRMLLNDGYESGSTDD